MMEKGADGLWHKKNAPVSTSAFERSGGEQLAGSFVIVCYRQQDGSAALFQNRVFQLGDFGGAIVLVGENLRGYIKAEGFVCGLSRSFIEKGEQNQLFTGSAGGTVGNSFGELFGGEVGFFQPVQHPYNL